MAKKSMKEWVETASCFRAKWSVLFCSFGTLLAIVGIIVSFIGFAVKRGDNHSTTLALCVTGPVMIACGFLPLVLSCIFWTYLKPIRYTDKLQTSDSSPKSFQLPSSPKSDITGVTGSYDIFLGIKTDIISPKLATIKHQLPSKVQTPKNNNSPLVGNVPLDVSHHVTVSYHQPSSQANVVPVKKKNLPVYQPKHQSIPKSDIGDTVPSDDILRPRLARPIRLSDKHLSLPQPLMDGLQSSTSSDRSSKPIVKTLAMKLLAEDKQIRRVSFDDVDTIYFTEENGNTRRNRRKISRTGGNYLTIY